VISRVSYYLLSASSDYHLRFQFTFYSFLSIPRYWYPAAIGKYKPQDATTNPSLILAASKKPEYAKLIDVAIEYGKSHGKDIDEKTDAALDRLLVEFGKEILKIVPGKVSTEVDARFSFDTQGSVDKALHIIEVRNRSTHKSTRG
jgi:transaldolase